MITKNIAGISQVPNRATQTISEFDFAASAFANEVKTLATDVNTWTGQANSLATQVNEAVDVVEAAKEFVVASANISTYSPSTTYVRNNTVSGSDNHLYRCIVNSVQGQDPVTTTGSWVRSVNLYSSFRNLIVNPEMRVSQRGNVFTNPANLQFTLDQFYVAKSGTMTSSVAQVSGSPSPEFSNSMEITTAVGSSATADHFSIATPLEGYGVRSLIGKTFTLSFFVKSRTAGQHYVSLRNGPRTKSLIAGYVVNTANVWEFKSVTVVGGLPADFTPNYDNYWSMHVSWTLKTGTAMTNATQNSWLSGNFIASSNQVNLMASAGVSLSITGIQLEVGDHASPFEHLPAGIEKSMCQRYYCALGKEDEDLWASGYGDAGNPIMMKIDFPVEMREIPVVSIERVYPAQPGTFGRLNVSDVSIYPRATVNSAYALGSMIALGFGEWWTNGSLYFDIDATWLT